MSRERDLRVPHGVVPDVDDALLVVGPVPVPVLGQPDPVYPAVSARGPSSDALDDLVSRRGAAPGQLGDLQRLDRVLAVLRPVDDPEIIPKK